MSSELAITQAKSAIKSVSDRYVGPVTSREGRIKCLRSSSDLPRSLAPHARTEYIRIQEEARVCAEYLSLNYIDQGTSDEEFMTEPQQEVRGGEGKGASLHGSRSRKVYWKRN